MATHLSQSSPLTGKLDAELLENHHINVSVSRPLGKSTSFIVDVACLAPSFAEVKAGRLGVGVAALVAVSMGLIAGYGFLNEMLLSRWIWAVVALVSFSAAAGLVALFRARSLPQIVVRTRHSGLPLFTIPVVRSKKREIESFLRELQARIVDGETKRGLTPERLRSGEMKTLRRLANDRVIPAKAYDDAKSALLNG